MYHMYLLWCVLCDCLTCVQMTECGSEKGAEWPALLLAPFQVHAKELACLKAIAHTIGGT